MLYQLSSGKTISISFEQWLDLTDEDIQYLVSINYGDTILSPFFRSSIKTTNKQKPTPEDDDSIDYIEETDEIDEIHRKFVPFDEEATDLSNLNDLEE